LGVLVTSAFNLLLALVFWQALFWVQEIDYLTASRWSSLGSQAEMQFSARLKKVFKTVIPDGPRKTWMGEKAKRFYMECRKIIL
jgi:hypothetical protein